MGELQSGDLRCGGVAVWGSPDAGSQDVEELHYVGVAVVTKPVFIAF